MRYENMPKGSNKDICVRCGKRANFADRLKSAVQYDLLCLAETTSSGYMTHGNVKLCGKCMSELLMWLDADDFCSYGCRSEKPNNSTSSILEQVDKDINVRSKDEPQTCSFSDCDNFKNPDYERCIECKRKQIKLKTEQTERSSE